MQIHLSNTPLLVKDPMLPMATMLPLDSSLPRQQIPGSLVLGGGPGQFVLCPCHLCYACCGLNGFDHMLHQINNDGGEGSPFSLVLSFSDSCFSPLVSHIDEAMYR